MPITADDLLNLKKEGNSWGDISAALEGELPEEEAFGLLAQAEPKFKSFYDEKVPYRDFRQALTEFEKEEAEALSSAVTEGTGVVNPQGAVEPISIGGGEIQSQVPKELDDAEFFSGATPPTQDLSAELQPAELDAADSLAPQYAPLTEGLIKAEQRYDIGKQNLNMARAVGRGDITYEQAKTMKQSTPPELQGEDWVSESALSVAEMLPGLLQSTTSGLEAGIGTGAMTGGAAAATTGPGAPVTAPAAAAAGFALGSAYGSTKVWQEQGEGDLYMTLRDEGVSDSVARPVATAFSIPYAAIELLQVNKLIPTSVKNKVGGVFGKQLANTVTRFLADKGIDYTKNVAQEVVQEAITATGEKVGEEIAGIEAPADKKPILDRLVETAKQAAGSFAILSTPGIAVDAVAAIQSNSAEIQRQQEITKAATPMEVAANQAEELAPATAEATRQEAQTLQRTARFSPPTEVVETPPAEPPAPEPVVAEQPPSAETSTTPNTVRVMGMAPNGFFSAQQDLDLDTAEKTFSGYDSYLTLLQKCLDGR